MMVSPRLIMNELDRKILDIANYWHSNKSEIQESDYEKFVFAKKMFTNKYFEKTGISLNISKKVETTQFNRICAGLSKNYEFSDELLKKYISWCFNNFDFFIKKYKTFNLNVVVLFATDWRKNFLIFNEEPKVSYDDLSSLVVSQNFFYYCEKYGIVLTTHKLLDENRNKKKEILLHIKNKIFEMPKSTEGLNKLRNILRTTVENAPYDKKFEFHDYTIVFKDYFKYFNKEPWCKEKV